MQNRPSRHPRDDAIRAALRDAAVLAGIISDEFHVTYQGPERAEYLRVLAANVTDLGGALGSVRCSFWASTAMRSNMNGSR